MIVLLTTYLNCGCEEPEPDLEVSSTKAPRILLIIVVFQDSVSAWEYASTFERTEEQAWSWSQQNDQYTQ